MDGDDAPARNAPVTVTAPAIDPAALREMARGVAESFAVIGRAAEGVVGLLGAAFAGVAELLAPAFRALPPEQLGHAPADPCAGEAAFLRALADLPGDDGPRLVYADWLEERGRADDAQAHRDFVAARRAPAG